MKYDKINYLNNNPDEYKKLLYQLYELLEDKYFDVRFIHELFDDILNIKFLQVIL